MDAVVGVDAHRRSHTLVAVDLLGRKLAQQTIGTKSEAHAEALRWARTRLGTDVVWGIEDCRALTAGLERDLLAAGQKVVRVPAHLMGRARLLSRERGKSGSHRRAGGGSRSVARTCSAGRLSRSAVHGVAPVGRPPRGPHPTPGHRHQQDVGPHPPA